MNLGAAAANAGWFAASLPEWLRFRRATNRLEATQRQVLDAYLRANANTDFGLEHGFAKISRWEDYASAVPPRSYDEFQPWIERVAQDEADVLTSDPVTLLEPSSGSSGAEKWVPYNETLRAEIRRGVAAWIVQNFIEDPRLIAGRAYWSLTPRMPREDTPQTLVPVGFDEDSAYLGGVAQQLVTLTMATTPALAKVRDIERFWRATLLLLLGCEDLRLISVWHPSYLMLLLERLGRDWASLLEDLRFGCDIDGVRIPALPVRANELSWIDPAAPNSIWPHLRLISCWGDAHASHGLTEIETAFPEVRVQPKGLVATEAFVTLPFGEHRPLAVRSHFFEFEDERGRVHPAWHLRQGQRYSVIVTTGGGLYRYRLQDRVEVTGYLGETPSLRFLGKEDSVSDFFGEKLSEDFVSDLLNELFRRHVMSPRFAMLAIERTAEPARYTLFIEHDAVFPDELAAQLEAGLKKNPHYSLCIELGQLAPAAIQRVDGAAYENYTRRLMDQGMRLGDIKAVALSRHPDWLEHFES